MLIGKLPFQIRISLRQLGVSPHEVAKRNMAFDLCRTGHEDMHLILANTGVTVLTEVPPSSNTELTHRFVAQTRHCHIAQVDLIYGSNLDKHVDDGLRVDRGNGGTPNMVNRYDCWIEGPRNQLRFSLEFTGPTPIVLLNYDFHDSPFASA